RGAKAGSVAASTGVGGGPGGMRGGSRAALARAAAQETATIGLREAATGRVPVTTGHVASVATVTVSATGGTGAHRTTSGRSGDFAASGCAVPAPRLTIERRAGRIRRVDRLVPAVWRLD